MLVNVPQVFAVLLIATACHGARQAMLPNASTRAASNWSSPAPTPSMLAPSMPPTAPVVTCPDAVSYINPLGKLRNAMRNVTFTQMNALFDAFLVFYSDEHLSEDPSPEERRLQYISGWDGAGMAAVLADGGAAIWVPSGDVRRARASLTCAWLVIDAEDPSQPNVAEYISEQLGRKGRVAGDARLVSWTEWQPLSSSLQSQGLQLIHAPTLLDQLWSEEQDPALMRPEFSRVVATVHGMEYAGQSWRDKVSALRNELRAIGADAMVVTALDEVAWLLNVRGRDLPTAPLLKAFVIISLRELRIYAPPGKLSMPVREALSVYNCLQQSFNCSRVIEYNMIYADLRRITESRILIPAAGSFQRGASAAIAQSVPQSKRLAQISPIIYLKAQKNGAEAEGMRKAHVRDAVAMCTLFSYIQKQSQLTEQTVALKVDLTRATQAGYVGLSMKTRVSFGPNTADPYYMATKFTDRKIFKNGTLVIQSGGQYAEGTTVVTRTVHFGKPTKSEKVAYTTVLRSLSALATLQTPSAIPAGHVDPVARAALWAANQDYPHSTGHGVGAALNVREDPVVIDYRQDINLHTFREGYFITSEPAWYESGKFGVKLGNVLKVLSKPGGYLAFKEATLVPFEPNLIDKDMLTDYEIKWLNAYNRRIRDEVGPELQQQGLTDVYYWMMNKTVYVNLPSKKVVNAGHMLEKIELTSLMIGLMIAVLL